MDKKSYDIHAIQDSLTPEHYTPLYLLDGARATMGGIDIDPGSCDVAQKNVQAAVYYTEQTDGLDWNNPWKGRAWINPPGDRTGQLPKRFYSRLVYEIYEGNVTEYMWLAFNISHFRTLQTPAKGARVDKVRTMEILEASSICILSSRIPFTGSQPSRDSGLIYYGPNKEKFRKVFKPLGAIW